MSGFVHLHVHTEYSMLQATAKVGALVKKAQALGQSALALTDHGNMFGMLEFWMAAKKANFKAIVGCDLYIAPDRRTNTQYLPGQPLYHQLILLAKDGIGYKNLLAICSDGHLDGFFQKPRIDLASLQGRCEGLICITPCHVGEPGAWFLRNQEKKAHDCLEAYTQLFGRENLYLGAMDHGVAEEKKSVTGF